MSRSLPEWLAFIEGLHPREIELGLERVRAAAEQLGLLRAPLAPLVITVAGTNGKGSLVHALQAQCRTAGRRVMAYTSPHLVRYNERIRLDGLPVPDAELCEAFAVVYAACRDIPLTYFEFGTLAMGVLCRRHAPDVLLLEVGMGGRLDAVNVLEPDIAVVTSIGLDHCDWLGDTREQIGFEKAGIFRAGRPALCADRDAPRSIREQAAAVGAQLLQLGVDFEPDSDISGTLPDGTDPDLAATVSQVCRLAGVPFAPAALGDRPPGRWQLLERDGREFVLDVAHNPQATERLAARLGALPVRRTLAVFGLLAGRDPLAVTRPLWPLVQEWLTVETTGARGCSAQSLSRILAAAGQQAAALDAGRSLPEAVLAGSGPGDRILVFGSFQVVGGLLTPDLNQLRTSQPWTG